MKFHLLPSVLVLLSGFLHRPTAARQSAVHYEYVAPQHNSDYTPAATLKLKPLKQGECDCGYVLVEKIVHVCRPQKSLVKVLRNSGNCLLHEKTKNIEQNYVDYRFKPDPLQSISPCDDSSQEDFE